MDVSRYGIQVLSEYSEGTHPSVQAREVSKPPACAREGKGGSVRCSFWHTHTHYEAVGLSTNAKTNQNAR